MSKRNRLMLGKGKKQKGGFFASLIDEIWGYKYTIKKN